MQGATRERRSGSPVRSKLGGIQFINETDSIIADSNGRIFSSIDSSLPTAEAVAASGGVAIGSGSISAMGMPCMKRPVTTRSQYLTQSDDSCDSYDDEIDQLVFTSRDPRRRAGKVNCASGSSLVTNDGPRPGKKTKGRVKIKMEFIRGVMHWKKLGRLGRKSRRGLGAA
jgi:hypothetical protein